MTSSPMALPRWWTIASSGGSFREEEQAAQAGTCAVAHEWCMAVTAHGSHESAMVHMLLLHGVGQ